MIVWHDIIIIRKGKLKMDTSILTTYTFKTGLTVQIKKVNTLLMNEIRKSFPPPRPPKERVNYGTKEAPDLVEEVNEASPEYTAALDKYNQDLEMLTRKILVKRGVIYTLTPEQKEEVKQLREDMEETGGPELDKDDKLVFIAYLAIGDEDDYTRLIRTIVATSQPTEEKVKENQDSFRGDVQGS
jgi:hypothetical protein